jgi:hypothetical protein
MTRPEALAKGERFYTVSRPCGRCNGTRRYTCNYECAACRADRSREYYHATQGYRERRLAQRQDRYWAMTGTEYARELLRLRRSKALRRMTERTRPKVGEDVGQGPPEKS